jgi:hypothetical protein
VVEQLVFGEDRAEISVGHEDDSKFKSDRQLELNATEDIVLPHHESIRIIGRRCVEISCKE